MKHVESSIKVFFTSEYSRFNMINGNRQLNNAKINRIKKDILQGLDVLRFCPILVIENGDRLDIIDGRHRFYVARSMQSKVWYILVEKFSLVEIAKINSNTEKWNSNDFINCYIQQNNQHYLKLREFMEEHGLPLSVSQRLLANGKITSDSGMDARTADAFKRGKFEVKCLSEAEKFINSVKLFNNFCSWNSRHFLIAIETILKADKCDFVELVDKFKASPDDLKKRNSVKE